MKFNKNFPAKIWHYDVQFKNAVRDTSVKKTGTKVAFKANPKRSQKGKDDADSKPTLPERILPAIWREFEVEFKEFLKDANGNHLQTPFDNRKNIFTRARLAFPNGDSFTGCLEMQDPDDPEKKRKFEVTVKCK